MQSPTPTQPEPFPNPVIRRSTIRKINVQVNQSIERKTVVESGSGNFYEICSLLKKAIFGQVVHAIQIVPGENDVYIRTDNHMAIKVYSKKILRALQGKTQENPLMEITALQYIGDNHPNLMGQLECCTDEENIYSVMRYIKGGELFDYIDEHGPMDEKQARVMFLQLLNGLLKLQELGIGHRDMSLENILYDADELFVIIDFGMCLRLHFDTTSNQFCPIYRQQICGKKNYISPEVLRGDEAFNPMVSDIWALGVILFICLTGVPPVDKATPEDERYNMICENKLAEMLNTWGIELGPAVVDLIQNILQPDPMRRPTLQDILQHPWMNM